MSAFLRQGGKGGRTRGPVDIGIMEMVSKRIRANLASWRSVERFLGHIGAHATRLVVEDLAKRRLDEELRIGTAMHTIIFSTHDRHGLSDQPRVGLLVDQKADAAWVRYSDPRGVPPLEYGSRNRLPAMYHRLDPPDPAVRISEVVPFAEAAPTVMSCLRRLWLDTKHGQPMPAGLSSRRD